ncbi:hypothetical protein ACGFIW_01300 [Micromonospora sp. NPDC048935]|uniref:hypothetical protein n=1 Tax=Micromonospora sp. NPDC048935 TaxID=3364262 RepID=UPI0037233EA9
MTDTTTLPQVNSQWTGNDSRIFTVTGMTTIHGKPHVTYDVGAAGAGVADLDYFLTHHTEVS